MAFNISNFDPTGSGSKGAPKIATYSTTDNTATVVGAGYFNDMASILQTGDLIYVDCSDGSDIYRVAVSAGVVTLGVDLNFA